MLLTAASDVLSRISYPDQLSSPPSGACIQIQVDIVSCIYVRRLISVDELEETSRISMRFVQPTTAALPPPLSPFSLSLSLLLGFFAALTSAADFLSSPRPLGALKDRTVDLSLFGSSPCGYII